MKENIMKYLNTRTGHTLDVEFNTNSEQGIKTIKDVLGSLTFDDLVHKGTIFVKIINGNKVEGSTHIEVRKLIALAKQQTPNGQAWQIWNEHRIIESLIDGLHPDLEVGEWV